jgi:hypothetical protein
VEEEDIHVQHSIKNLQQRSVKLDVLATDSTGKVYNIEIQRDDRGAGVRRARYNSSMIDTTMLKIGESTDRLNDTYVIFITERDVLGKDKPIYHIDRVIRETGEVFQDGSHILYVNGSRQDDTPLGKLMHDFHCTRASDMTYPDLAKKVRYYKEQEGGNNTMCKLLEDFAKEMKEEWTAEAKAEAKAKGKIENGKETALKMIEDGLPLETIVRYSGLTLEQVEELAKKV